MNDYIHEIKMKVRDYECDLQQIVNNANYQHYLEHARHEFIHEHQISFADLHNRGIDFVVSKVEMNFKVSLRSLDEFVCRLKVKKEGVKYVFYQNIYRLPDLLLCVKAKVETVCVVEGQLVRRSEMDDLLAHCLYPGASQP